MNSHPEVAIGYKVRQHWLTDASSSFFQTNTGEMQEKENPGIDGEEEEWGWWQFFFILFLFWVHWFCAGLFFCV
jgi:hypothetical protein